MYVHILGTYIYIHMCIYIINTYIYIYRGLGDIYSTLHAFVVCMHQRHTHRLSLSLSFSSPCVYRFRYLFSL